MVGPKPTPGRRGTDPDSVVALALERRRGMMTQGDVTTELRELRRLGETAERIETIPNSVQIVGILTVDNEGAPSLRVRNGGVEDVFSIWASGSGQLKFSDGTDLLFHIDGANKVAQFHLGTYLALENAAGTLSNVVLDPDQWVLLNGIPIEILNGGDIRISKTGGGQVFEVDGETGNLATLGTAKVTGDNTSALVVETAAGVDVLRVNTTSGIVAIQSGADLILFSDAGTTEIFRVDGATGNIQSLGQILAATVVHVNSTSAFVVENASGVQALRIDANSPFVKLLNGADLILYSDNNTTIQGRWDAASGHIEQAEQSAPATPNSGYARLYPNSTGQYEAKDDNGDVWAVGKTQPLVKGSDQTISTTSLTTVSGLSFTVRANTTYVFEYFLVHQSAASTTGLKLAINVATATVSAITYQTEISVLNTANGTANVETQMHTANNGTHTAANQAAGATSSVAKVTGVLIVGGTGGTLNLQFAGDAAANITAKAGSFGRLSVA